jgi:hypothetical protein
LRTGGGQFPLRMGQDLFKMPRHLYSLLTGTAASSPPADG